jgi:uncharacterized membrane protein
MVGTIVVAVILFAVLAAIIAYLVRQKRAGKNLSCEACEMEDHCNGQCGLTQEMLDDMQQALDEHDAERKAAREQRREQKKSA